MATIPTISDLSIPEYTLKDCSVVELDPEAIQIWLKTLQISNLGETTKKIYYLLKESNQIALSYELRFAILELLHPWIFDISKQLEKHYIQQNRDLRKKQIHIMQLDESLKTQMCYGFKSIIIDILKSNSQKEKQTLFSKSIYDALYYFSLSCLKSTQNYNDTHKKIFKEAHTLYFLSEQHKITNLKTHKNNSIENIYKQFMLFYALNPFQFRKSEQEILYYSISCWLPYFSIQNIKKSTLPEKRPDYFIIDLSSESPPFSQKQNQEIETPEHAKILNASKLLEHFKTILKDKIQDEKKRITLNTQIGEMVLPTSVIQKLAKNLEKLQFRQSDRLEKTGKIRVSFGLSNTHYFISGKKPFSIHAKSKDTPHTTAAQKLENESLLENHSNIPTFAVEEHTEDEFGNKVNPDRFDFATSNLEELQFKLQVLELVDISVSGYLLSWKNNQYPAIQAGDIVGLQECDSKNPLDWKVGVIRWLKHISDEKIHIGVELISTNTKAVGAQLLKSEKPVGFSMRSLLLYEEDDETKDNIVGLITPTVPFKEKNWVNLYATDNFTPLKALLDKLVDATGGYSQFQVKLKSNTNKINLKEDLEAFQKSNFTKKEIPIERDSNNKEDFDSLWSNL